MGEFIRAWGEGKRVRGGLWLSGLLLKPQILVLMFPFLVFSGEWGIAGGFAIGAAAIGMISLVIGGTEGIKAWAALLTHHATRLPTTGPGIMINLRMVSELLSLLFSLDVQRIAGIVAIAIALLTLWFSLRLREQAPEEKLGVMVPLLAATFVTTWHAHMHMAMAFIPLLLHQVITGRMPLRLFGLWTMLPPAVYFLCVADIVLLTVSGVQLPPIEGVHLSGPGSAGSPPLSDSSLFEKKMLIKFAAKTRRRDPESAESFTNIVSVYSASRR
jgi:hypothetical protein